MTPAEARELKDLIEEFLKKKSPERIGWVLIVAPVNQTLSWFEYLSSLKREDAIQILLPRVLQDLQERQEPRTLQ
jgi:hypothetical protein